MYGSLLVTTDIDAAATTPKEVLERRLVKKGNIAAPQVWVSWIDFLASATTWEDYNMLGQRFSDALAWGQASPLAGEV
jgi:hypothetical protein